MASIETPILITGGLGYVGGRIAEHLGTLVDPSSIRLLTRRSKNYASWSSKFDVLTGDFSNLDCLRSTLEGVHTVIHLASPNEIESMKDPLLASDVTTRSTLTLLMEAASANVKRFIYFSTFHVYGNKQFGQIREELLPKPVHPYAISHYAAEGWVNMFRYNNKLETLILRLSNCYGAPMDNDINRWMLVFNDLCRQAATTELIQLTSSGKPQRDFISLKEVARTIQHFLSMPYGFWESDVYNLGGACSMSIISLADRISRVYTDMYHRTISIQVNKDPDSSSTDPVDYNIDRLKNSGFIPTHNLDDEIKRTLNLCKHS